MDHLQYPIGRFIPRPDYSSADMQDMIRRLEALPTDLSELVADLPETALANTYRPGSWNIRQLVHHLADVHLLFYLRMKKALTEPDQVATMIEMNKWSNLPDAAQAPVISSLAMMAGINQRFIYFLEHLSEADLQHTYYHPTRQIQVNLKQTIFMTGWHAAHHLGHIELALGRSPRAFEFST